ncbi:hypothetical protein Pst134EA_019598 [Puccinia striiformis f. sp. tritici]|uniref:hypothetical protein n=1 Tax=Puccinia striiformis f. sp. tritici TaxID=168172 RepID=UPI002007453F|nr:hypothetical protein Pst134EA_019598 [Puccinia striiformis f. sp. tritici]KAH9459444.1 hypothetical protein Pst134EA_019598 [Puccinia striiformis f. sp. tritici]KAI9618669.1 hypothetical protein KEM48_006648 [Puccinia striiformis f. sp. tritici PST-130]
MVARQSLSSIACRQLSPNTDRRTVRGSPIHPPSSKPYSTSARSSRPAPHQHWYGRVNRSATSPSRIHLYAICLSPAIQSAAVNQRIMKVNLLLLSLGQVTQIYRLRMDAA